MLLLFVSVWFFPESPRWLVKVGREEEGRYILGRLRGNEGEDRARADAEFRDIQSIAEMEQTFAQSNSYFALITGYKSGKLHLGRRAQLVMWLQIIQEWVGIAGVTVCMGSPPPSQLGHRIYKLTLCIVAPTIFGIAGYDSVKSQWLSGLNNIFYMVCPENDYLRSLI